MNGVQFYVCPSATYIAWRELLGRRGWFSVYIGSIVDELGSTGKRVVEAKAEGMHFVWFIYYDSGEDLGCIRREIS